MMNVMVSFDLTWILFSKKMIFFFFLNIHVRLGGKKNCSNFLSIYKSSICTYNLLYFTLEMNVC
jgi:hypothetical protein